MSDSPEKKISPTSPELETLIDRYLQLSDEGKVVDVDHLCVEVPHLADSLRSFIAMDVTVGQIGETDVNQTLVPESPTGTDTTPPTHAGKETLLPGSEEETTIAPQEEMLGRYKLIKLLGQGAMGSVYLAEDTSLERQVALKIPKFSKDHEQELMTRFLREARSAAAVNHPNICKVLDISEAQDKPFLTMDYIDGDTLSSHIGGEQLAEEQQIVQLMITLSHALDDAHTQGIIHRDLKPGNVMINSKGIPFITDFGLARKIDQTDDIRLTQEGTILGTPAYMSPEQIEGDPEKIGPQSDQYSLGVIFYELLTGELPFKGTIPMMLGQILRDIPQSPGKLRKGLEKQLEAICLKMLEKLREKRYASCADVAKELQSWIEKQSEKLKTPVAAKTSAKTKQPASKKLQAHKQDIEKLIKEGQLASAMQTLEKMTQIKAQGAEKYVAWAKTELTKTKKLAKQYRDNLTTNIATAKKLITRHDYDAAVKLLQQIPPEFRNDESSELLEEAIALQDEVTWLIEDIRGSLKTRKLKGIDSNLTRLLELKPGNKMARELHESLNTYSSGKKFSFDDRGMLLPSASGFDAFGGVKVAAIVGGVAFLLMLGAITIYLNSGGQTIEVTLQDPSWTVYIDDNHVELEGKENTITLDVGDHIVRVENNGTVVEGWNKFKYVVKEGENEVLVIRLLDKPVKLVTNGSAPPLAKAPFNLTTAKKHQQAWAKYLGLPVEKEVTFPDGVKMLFMLIPPGEFMMGSTDEDRKHFLAEAKTTDDKFSIEKRIPTEGPQHRVTISKPFYLGKYEVMQSEWKAVMGSSPSLFKGNNLPVENISWDETDLLLKKLNSEYKAEGMSFALPTEAQWEYACRAGTTTTWHCGDSKQTLTEYAWYKEKSEEKTHPVGELKPNPWGMYDIHGNVREYCSDWFSENYYTKSPAIDPTGPATGTDRVDRGGVFSNYARYCRSAERGFAAPDTRVDKRGVRLALMIDTTMLKLNPVASTGSPDKIELVRKFELRHKQAIRFVKFIANGKRVISTDGFGTYIVWDAQTGKQLTYLNETVNIRNSFTDVSADGRYLLGRVGLGTEIDEIQLWDLERKERVRTLGKHSGSFLTVRFSPDATQAVTATGKGPNALKLWNVVKGKEIRTIPAKGGYSMAISPDGKRAVAAEDAQGTMALWDLTTGDQLALSKIMGITTWHSAFSPDGRLIVTVGARFSPLIQPYVTVFDATNLKQLWQVKAHDDRIQSVRFLPDSRHLLTGAMDGTIILWDATTGKQVTRSQQESHATNIIDISPDGQFIVSGGGNFYNGGKGKKDGDYAVRLWRIRDVNEIGKPLATNILPQRKVDGWTNLFNGKDLSGWRYATCKPSKNTTNKTWGIDDAEHAIYANSNDDLSRIETEKLYGNFDLELEWNLLEQNPSGSNGGGIVVWSNGNTRRGKQAGNDPSGVEIDFVESRSIPPKGNQPEVGSGCLISYEVPIVHSTKAVPLNITNNRQRNLARLRAPNQKPNGEWNTVRVKCLNGRMTIWMNEILVNEVWDSQIKQGHICLQTQKSRIKYRNIRIRELDGKGKPLATNILPQRKVDGWANLFNGKDLSGWKPMVDASKWKVNNGVLSGSGTAGVLLTEKEYSDFEIELEFKPSTATNSGIFLRIPATGKLNGGDFMEVQLLDDTWPQYANLELDWVTGSLYKIAPVSKKPNIRTNEWNKIRVKAVGTQISTWVNDQQLVNANLDDYPQQTKARPNSLRPTGHIGLQRHSESKVEFRNIRIRELDKNGSPLTTSSLPVATDPDRVIAKRVLQRGGSLGLTYTKAGSRSEIHFSVKDISKLTLLQRRSFVLLEHLKNRFMNGFNWGAACVLRFG